MIQRIQTVYLLLIIAAGVALMVLNPLLVEIPDARQVFFSHTAILPKTEVPIIDNWAATGVTTAVILWSAIIIFGYKNRRNQVKMLYFNFLLILGLTGAMLSSLTATTPETTVAPVTYWQWIALPVIMLVLNFLALNRVKHDIALVASADRLR